MTKLHHASQTSSDDNRNTFAYMLRDGRGVIIIITWVLASVSSIPFDRINFDEVLFLLEARRTLVFGPFVHSSLIFVPQVAGAFAVAINNSLISVRIISALAVLITAILIHAIRNDDSAFISAMLFLTSFYTIRYGFRYFLDPYGALFVMATLYFLYKGRSRLAGITSMLGVFSTAYAAPLFVVFVVIAYFKREGLRKFATGALLVGLIGFLWIYLSDSGIQGAVVTNVSSFATVSSGIVLSPYPYMKSWAQYALISPLVIAGVFFSWKGSRGLEFYAMVFSFVITSFVPGFLQFGGATEYPYIFGSIACVSAGAGLETAYKKLGFSSKSLVKVVVAVLVIQFLAQSYLATTLNANHEVGIEDYGYWYDQELLSYLNANYHGGQIYSSISTGLLDSKLSSDWTTMYGVSRALADNPPWVVTYSSYAIVEYVPANATIANIGPYLIIHRGQTPLASFVEPSNITGFFQYEPNY